MYGGMEGLRYGNDNSKRHNNRWERLEQH